MLLGKILFPAPDPPHYTLTSHRNHLFWLPPPPNFPDTPHIPCMLYSPSRAAKYFIIWCHGNGCDMGTMHMTLTTLSRRLQAHAIIFEYPTYGLLKGVTSSPDEATINHYANCVYAFVQQGLQWPAHRIIVYGHSIGSGAACHIASTRPVGGLILQSPYTSIKDLVREKVGVFVNVINSSIWDNYEAVKYSTCPILFIHGRRDTLIPCHHSEILYNSLNHTMKKQLVILPNDDHNSISDPTLLIHVKPFLSHYFRKPRGSLPRVSIDPALRAVPPENLALHDGSTNNRSASSFSYISSAFIVWKNLSSSILNSWVSSPNKQKYQRSRSSRNNRYGTDLD